MYLLKNLESTYFEISSNRLYVNQPVNNNNNSSAGLIPNHVENPFQFISLLSTHFQKA
jgi:hypothetical protein